MRYMVYSFTFHLSGLCPYDDEHRAMEQLLTLCFAQHYNYKLHWSDISSVDSSVTIDVYNISLSDQRRFLHYSALNAGWWSE